jgi:cytochrome c-type biogenesis protein CcmH
VRALSDQAPSGAGAPASGTRRSVVGLTLVLVAAVVALGIVLLRGPERPLTLDERVQEVAAGLRCPVCQNLSVADSSSALAHEMREAIALDLRAGKSSEEIRQEFAASYGDWILLAPRRSGINLIAWGAPALLLVVGAAIAVARIRRWRSLGGSMLPEAGFADTSGDRRRGAVSAADRQMLEEQLSTVTEDSE